ncbi:MAG: hypothetical protein ABI334_09820 [Candidatus Dormiibacterota bacterium]
MSDTEDLELEAMQRELDDAFETTRPRPGFEDELWMRMQAQRPAPARLRDAWMGFVQGIREVPRVPMAAVAATLVVVIGVGLLAYSGLGHGGGGSTSSLSAGGAARSGAQGAQGPPGEFGRLPAPALNPTLPGADSGKQTPTVVAPQGPPANYAGPVTLTWAGKLNLTITSAPVYRYREPSTNTADQFAAGLGAIPVSRPAGYLGSYETTEFNIRVRGTVQTPPREPTFIMLPISSVASGDAAGGPTDVAVVFLSEHSLAPDWPYTLDVGGTADQPVVRLLRQFSVAGYGLAYLVDPSGQPYGIEVDLKANRPTLASGPVALTLDTASYPLITGDQAVSAALASSPPAAGSGPAAPSVKLTTAELVYVLVVAGDHSFYEPAFLFSGTFSLNGVTYTKHVVVPGVDHSQLG